MRPVDIDYDALRIDLGKGMTHREVAGKYNISCATVARLAKKCGCKRHAYGGELNKEEKWWEDFWNEWDEATAKVMKGLNRYGEKDFDYVIRRFRGCFSKG